MFCCNVASVDSKIVSGFIHQDDSFKSKIAMFNNSSAKEPPPDPFQTEDPFKSFNGLNTFLYRLVIFANRDEDYSLLY